MRAIALASAAAAGFAAAQAPTPFSRILFDEPTVQSYGARCLDGSPAGYYWSPSPTSSAETIIFMQGGGACWSNSGPFSCWARYNTSLGSSSFWPATATQTGNFFDRDCDSNPIFCNYAYAYVVSGSARSLPVMPRLPACRRVRFPSCLAIPALPAALLHW